MKNVLSSLYCVLFSGLFVIGMGIPLSAQGQGGATAPPMLPSSAVTSDTPAPSAKTSNTTSPAGLSRPVIPKPASSASPSAVPTPGIPTGSRLPKSTDEKTTTESSLSDTFAKLTEEQQNRLIHGFTTLSQGDTASDTYTDLVGYFANPEIPAEDWMRLTAQYLTENSFNQPLGEAFRRILLMENENPTAVANTLGAIIGSILVSTLNHKPSDYVVFDLALAWLDSLVGTPAVPEIRTGLDKVLRKFPLDPAGLGDNGVLSTDSEKNMTGEALHNLPMAGEAAVKTEEGEPDVSPENAAKSAPISGTPTETPENAGPFALQAAISLGNYAGPKDIGQWLRLSAAIKRIVEESGVWVFDGGAMTRPQAESLASLLAAWPVEVTGVTVIFAGIPTAPLRYTGTAISVPYYPPDAGYPAASIPPETVLPAMPAFTAGVITELTRVIQQRELARNPMLAQRRNLVLQVAGSLPHSSLYAFLSAGHFDGSPEGFFPALTLCWMAGSETVLQSAGALSDLSEHEPIYAFLLLADLFSGGGDTTFLFAMNGEGKFIRQETSLRRSMLSPGRSYVTGVAAGGGLFGYDGADYEALLSYL